MESYYLDYAERIQLRQIKQANDKIAELQAKRDAIIAKLQTEMGVEIFNEAYSELEQGKGAFRKAA